MKCHKLLFAITLLLVFLSGLYSQAKKSTSLSASSSPKAFLGRWDLTVKAPDRQYPSWLEVSLDGDQLKAQMVGRWGNARPLPRIELSGGDLTFVSPKEEEASKNDLVFKAKLVGNTLVGTATGPDDASWTWIGRRAPSMKRDGSPKWGKPIQLFNGKDLTGWKPDKEHLTSAWKVEDGTLISPAHGPELINAQQFTDFKLHVEFNCGKGANSGIYLRGRYEVQIEDNSTQEPPSHHTGGLYGFIAPMPELPREPGEWQSFDITLIGRMLTLQQNGQTIIDHQEIPGITGGALDSHEERPGPIYLQGSEDGHVAFRNIVLTPAQK